MDDLISRSELIAQLEGFKLSLGDVILGLVVQRVISFVLEMPAAEVPRPQVELTSGGARVVWPDGSEEVLL